MLGAGTGLVTVRYTNGPTFINADPNEVRSFADFMTEFQGNLGKYPAGMKGSPAVVYGHFGKGLVILVSPHIEDGHDESAWAPFRNMFRLCHCVYQGAQLSSSAENTTSDGAPSTLTSTTLTSTDSSAVVETIRLATDPSGDISGLLSTPAVREPP